MMPLTKNVQYEVDGSIETHNPDLPSTTSCPYMPGQSVNTLIVPVEQALRNRSASLNSMRPTDFKSMNPQSKFTTLRPIPSAPADNPPFRLGSSPLLNHKSSTRSLSPAPAWKRFFTRKLTSRDGERGRSPERDAYNAVTSDEADGRCTTPSEGTRTRDISPESLRRFLSDDVPSRPGSNLSVRPTLVIPDEITEDHDHDNDNDNDDDDNFATSAVSETQAYPTRLSPPPFRRTASCESGLSVNKASTTLMPTKASTLPVYQTEEVPASAVLPSRPRLEAFSSTQMKFTSSGYFTSPVSQYPDDEAQAYWYDLTDDEDDVLSSNNSDIFSGQPTVEVSKMESYECYSLPEHEERGSKVVKSQSSYAQINSPALLSRGDSELSTNGSNLLGSPINHGLDEFASELGWMVDIIGNKRH